MDGTTTSPTHAVMRCEAFALVAPLLDFSAALDAVAVDSFGLGSVSGALAAAATAVSDALQQTPRSPDAYTSRTCETATPARMQAMGAKTRTRRTMTDAKYTAVPA
eukprot:Amastigsp_a4042_13.p4 type:complete len:106 gc:universal Amastigsp_a4042_13:1485-1168(-)